MSLETYGLDPIHYYSSPGLSWDAMIKYTGVELELITDPDMHQMVELVSVGLLVTFGIDMLPRIIPT